MPFLEQRLSDAVARGSKGGPRASRTKTYVQSGALKQQFNWSRPLHHYDISYGIKTAAEFEEVRALWMVVNFGAGGPYSGFRIKDWGDYTVTRSNGVLSLVSGTTWQLKRRYARGAATFDRKLTKPVAGTVLIYDAGGSVLAATVDTSTGTAVVTGTPASWAGQFDVPVTFVNDELDNIELDGTRGHELQGLGSIMLEELSL